MTKHTNLTKEIKGEVNDSKVVRFLEIMMIPIVIISVGLLLWNPDESTVEKIGDYVYHHTR